MSDLTDLIARLRADKPPTGTIDDPIYIAAWDVGRLWDAVTALAIEVERLAAGSVES